MGKSFRRPRSDWDDDFDYRNKSNKFKHRRNEKKKKNKMKTNHLEYDGVRSNYDYEEELD
jgi:hypothetical protein